jgi:tetratricopeptide (TPR) repeat protein
MGLGGTTRLKSKWLRLSFRLAAVVGIPLVILLSSEGILWLAGYGYPTGFLLKRASEGRSVWTDNPQFGRRFFPRGLQRRAQPFQTPAAKPQGELRIFVLGESAAMGDPDFKFGLPRMLGMLLRQRYPERRIEVINAAVVAINSHVILPIARDCAKAEGDLWVIYAGNNEVIGPYGSASVFGARAPALPLVRAGLWLKKTRMGQFMEAGLEALRQGKRPTPEWTGMEMMADERVRYDSPETQRVYRHFNRNLHGLLEAGAQTGVPMILCTVATNLKDCAPFASLHRLGLSPEALNQWQASYKAGEASQSQGNLTNALRFYAKAAEIDSEFADLAFRQAECWLLLGNEREAQKFFRQARDLDALQFRADSRVNEIIRATAAESANRRVSLVDADQLVMTNSSRGLPGSDFFYEHVHLTPEGNYLLARAIANQAIKALSLPTTGDWLNQSNCFRKLGLTDWNRYDALNTILDRIQSAPFTNQLNHVRQMQRVNEQLERYKMATKPAQIRQEAAQVAALVRADPEDPDLRWNLAALLQNLGDYAGAEEQWRALIRLQPFSTLPAFNLAKLLEAQGNPKPDGRRPKSEDPM